MNELIKFMNEKKLTVKSVAKFLNVKENTVRVWRSNPLRPIPSDKFRLLELGEKNGL